MSKYAVATMDDDIVILDTYKGLPRLVLKEGVPEGERLSTAARMVDILNARPHELPGHLVREEQPRLWRPWWKSRIANWLPGGRGFITGPREGPI